MREQTRRGSISVVDETREKETAAGQPETEVSADMHTMETQGQEATGQELDAETLSRQLEETRDQLMRVAAEFDNYKKRMERERSKLLKYAGENMLREFAKGYRFKDRVLRHAQVVVSSGPGKPA
jgi:molecular chaperone GrpE